MEDHPSLVSQVQGLITILTNLADLLSIVIQVFSKQLLQNPKTLDETIKITRQFAEIHI